MPQKIFRSRLGLKKYFRKIHELSKPQKNNLTHLRIQKTKIFPKKKSSTRLVLKKLF